MSNVTELFKHHENGQWELLEKADGLHGESPAHIHFSDGTKTAHTGRAKAVSQMHLDDYTPTDKKNTSWHHMMDPTKTATIIDHSERKAGMTPPKLKRKVDS